MSGVKLAALDPKFGLMNDLVRGTKLQTQNYLDLSTALRVRKQLELRIGVNNVFDREPPLIVRNTAAGGGPVNGNTYPEWYDLLGRSMFRGLSYVGALSFKPIYLRSFSVRPWSSALHWLRVAGSVQKSGILPVSRQYEIRPMRSTMRKKSPDPDACFGSPARTETSGPVP